MTNKKNMLSWVLKPSISIIAIIIIVLIGGGYLWFSSQREGDNVVVEGGEENGQEVENGDNTENLELNTEDWLTYRNEEYGFEVKYPEDCMQETDMDGNIFGIGGCKQFNSFLFEKIPRTPDFNKFNVEEIAEIYRAAMKEKEYNKNVPEDRLLSDIKEVSINGIKAYQLTFDWADCLSFNDDYSCNGGRVVNEKTNLIFMKNDNTNKTIKLEIPAENMIVNKMLSTFHFLN